MVQSAEDPWDSGVQREKESMCSAGNRVWRRGGYRMEQYLQKHIKFA